MNPDMPNWQGQTFLHDLCGGGRRGQYGGHKARAEILLAAGASIFGKRGGVLFYTARLGGPDQHAGDGRVSARAGRATELAR